MAKLATQTVIIQLSKAVSDDAKDDLSSLNDDVINQLKDIVKELVDDSIVVDVITQ